MTLRCSYQKQEHAVLPNVKVKVRRVGAAEDHELPAIVFLHGVEEFPLLLIQLVNIVQVDHFEVCGARGRVFLIHDCVG